MNVVIRSSAEIAADPERFLEDMRAGHIISLSDLGYTIAPSTIMTLTDQDIDEVEDMTSLRKDRTGVDNTIFISTKGYARHAPRIKIAIDPPDSFTASGKTASMAIHDFRITGEPMAPHLAEQAKQFIECNRVVLLEYWEGRLDTETAITRLRRP